MNDLDSLSEVENFPYPLPLIRSAHYGNDVNYIWKHRYRPIYRAITKHYFFGHTLHWTVYTELKETYKKELMITRKTIVRLYNSNQRRLRRKIATTRQVLHDEIYVDAILDILADYIM